MAEHSAEIAVLNEQMRQMRDDSTHIWNALEPLRSIPTNLDHLNVSVANLRQELRDHMKQEEVETASYRQFFIEQLDRVKNEIKSDLAREQAKEKEQQAVGLTKNQFRFGIAVGTITILGTLVGMATNLGLLGALHPR